MPDMREQIDEAAIGWLIRLRDGSAEDWQRFVEWLEESPAHADAYDEVAALHDALGDLPSPHRRPAVDVPRHRPDRRTRRRAFIGWAAAAALVVTAGYYSLRSGMDLYPVETGPGDRRSVALADGSRIDLNGGTRLLLDRENDRFARLESGEALFTVIHDPARPFRVEAGDGLLQDAGTVFNVVRSAGETEVAVAEGAIVFNPQAEAIGLPAGTVLRQERGAVTVARGAGEGIGGWRENRLSYSSAPISRIAADLARNLGVRVVADPEVADRRFSGVIMLEHDREQLFRRVSALLDVDARRTGEGWILTSGRGETR